MQCEDVKLAVREWLPTIDEERKRGHKMECKCYERVKYFLQKEILGLKQVIRDFVYDVLHNLRCTCGFWPKMHTWKNKIRFKKHVFRALDADWATILCHAHLNLNILQKRKRIYTCKICGRSFNNMHSYNSHAKHHRKEELYREVTCRICGMKFDSIYALGGHNLGLHYKHKRQARQAAEKAFMEQWNKDYK